MIKGVPNGCGCNRAYLAFQQYSLLLARTVLRVAVDKPHLPPLDVAHRMAMPDGHIAKSR
jgi:hypothetical protein